MSDFFNGFFFLPIKIYSKICFSINTDIVKASQIL